MNYRLKSLMLLAALPLCVAAMSRDAMAEDRFDIKIELLDFYSPRAADRPLNQPNVKYAYVFTAGINNGAYRVSTVNKRVVGRPKQHLKPGSTLHFTNVRKPDRSSRQIELSASTTAYYDGRTDGHHKIVIMGKTRNATNRDLFDEADHSRDDKAVQHVVVQNQSYRMLFRVTVIEVD